MVVKIALLLLWYKFLIPVLNPFNLIVSMVIFFLIYLEIDSFAFIFTP